MIYNVTMWAVIDASNGDGPQAIAGGLFEDVRGAEATAAEWNSLYNTTDYQVAKVTLS